MIKKYLIVLLFPVLLGTLQPSLVKAGPMSEVDQACISREGEYGRIWLNQHPNVIQLFAPTKNTLHMVTLGLGTTYPSAKARVKIIGISDGDISVIAQKYITVTEDQYYRIDFGNVPLIDDYYGIKVELANQREHFYWNALASVNGECNPGGFAMIGDMTTQGEIDMIFAVRTFDSPVTPEDSATTTASTSSDPAVVNDPTPSETASSPSSAVSTTTSVQLVATQPTATASSSSSTNTAGSVTSSSNILEKSTTTPTNDKSVAGDTTNANVTNENGVRLTTDKDLQEQIALLIKDLEENRYDDGAFGLTGRVGRILTWPVFYGICCLFLIIILFKVIKSLRKKDSEVKIEQGRENDQSTK